MKARWHILVVDDEEAMTESLAAWLREDGYTVDTASSGREAIEKARAREYAKPPARSMRPHSSPHWPGVHFFREASARSLRRSAGAAWRSAAISGNVTLPSARS